MLVYAVYRDFLDAIYLAFQEAFDKVTLWEGIK